MPQATNRLTLGPLHNPVRGLLHGSAAIASMALAAYLWSHADCPPSGRAALLVCALSQFGVYLASTLYHTLPWGPVAKWRMQRLDHSMIYVGIAGTLTPIVWLGLDDWRRGAIPTAAWCIAILGSLQKAFLPWIHEKASIPFQVGTACLVLPAAAPFALPRTRAVAAGDHRRAVPGRRDRLHLGAAAALAPRLLAPRALPPLHGRRERRELRARGAVSRAGRSERAGEVGRSASRRLHVLRRHVLHVGGEVPVVALAVLCVVHAVAPEHVLGL